MPTEVSNYAIGERLYESPFSVICRAVGKDTRIPVILKILNNEHPLPEERAAFENEYNIVKSCSHRGVVRFIQLKQQGGTLVIVEEDIGAVSLDLLMKQRRLTFEEAITIAAEVAESIAWLHDADIAHNNLNPSNIVWNRHSGELNVIDFGMASFAGSESPTPNKIQQGSLPYVSPEQTGRMNRAPDYRTDMYSLGATLYEALTGETPFGAGSAMGIVYSHIAKTPASPTHVDPSIPDVVSQIVMKLLAKVPEDRYQSMRCLNGDLRHCLAQLRATGRVEPFLIARRDCTGKLRMPPKLYGRESELQALVDAFENIEADGPSLVLVAGSAGVGKSALVHEAQRIIGLKGGRFVSGKYERHEQNVPYSAIAVAFNSLMLQLLAEPEQRLRILKERLEGAIGVNGRLLVDIMPAASGILGATPPVETLGPAEAQKRFDMVLSRFVRILCDFGPPLVVFLDDLQWADSASVRLINVLVSDARRQLIIGAYRDRELHDAHPLMSAFAQMRLSGVRIQTITLPPLTLPCVVAYLAEAFEMNEAEAKPHRLSDFATLLLDKTAGNPFFLEQFLKDAHARDLVNFDSLRCAWHWELAELHAAGITDNVVELLVGKIPPDIGCHTDGFECGSGSGQPFRYAHIGRVARMA